MADNLLDEPMPEQGDIAGMFPLTSGDDWDRLREAANVGLRTQPHVGLAVLGAKAVGQGIYEGGKRLLQTTKGVMQSDEVGAEAVPSSTMMDVASIFPLSGLMGISGKLALAANAPKAAPFFSAVGKAAETAPLTKGTTEQWSGWLKNQQGIKQEELDWIGLDDWLKGQKGPVTKQQVSDFVKANQVDVQEVVKGEPRPGKIDPVAQERVADALYGKTFGSLRKFEQDLVINEIAPAKPTKFSQYQLPGGPLSRDTELLTKAGWKRIDAVAVGDDVLTRKDEGGLLEWQHVEAVPTVYADKLYHFLNQSIDMMVTANHQMVVKRRRRSKQGIFRTTAAELWKMAECVVPLTGTPTPKSETMFGLDAKDVAEFVGWYLAEGSYKQRNGFKNTIQIAQSQEHNPENCKRLEALFVRLKLSWKDYGGAYGIGIRTMPQPLKEMLHAQPKAEAKFVPAIFFAKGSDVMAALLDGLVLGDGHVVPAKGSRQSRTMFFSKSERLAGDVQALAILTGRRATVRQRKTGLYVVYINRKQWASIDDAKHAIVPYNDIAFCVTVKNHTICVRRNGVAAFTGNSNYRELLLTMPHTDRVGDAYSARFKAISDKYGGITGPELVKSWTLSESAELSQLAKAADAAKREIFKGGHYDEPNVLAHVRFNDRVDAQGKKTLFIEEIQSDWHQKGRKQGYRDERIETEIRKLKGERDGLLEPIPEWGGPGDHLPVFDRDLGRSGSVSGAGSDTARVNQRLSEIATQLDALYAKARQGSPEGVPDAPFKTTWPELSLKRMIKWAADNGYDQIAWTPGKVQAARYDLSKHISDMGVRRYPDGTYSINATTDRGLQTIGEKIAADRLPDVVGKEMAEKITKDLAEYPKDFKKYEGVDLQVGGEGMAGFYDKMLVSTANKLGKKYGAKVGVTKVATRKESLADWFFHEEGSEWVATRRTGGEESMRFPSKAAAEEYVSQGSNEVWSLPITDAMREKVQREGMPLFVGAPPLPTEENNQRKGASTAPRR